MSKGAYLKSRACCSLSQLVLARPSQSFHDPLILNLGLNKFRAQVSSLCRQLGEALILASNLCSSSSLLLSMVFFAFLQIGNRA